MLPAIIFPINSPFMYHHIKSIVAEFTPEEAAILVYDEPFVRSFHELSCWPSVVLSVIKDSHTIVCPRTEMNVEDFPEIRVLVYHYSLNPPRPSIRYVRIPYSQSKSMTGIEEWNLYYHMILCPGEYFAKKTTGNMFKPIVGYPKFDDWFNNSVSNLSMFLRSGIPTLLYTPTWGTYSTLQEVIPLLNVLSEYYNIIIKPHHNLVFRTGKSFFKRYRGVLSRGSEYRYSSIVESGRCDYS